MNHLNQQLARALAERREAGLYRQSNPRSGPQGAIIEWQGRQCLNFCGNDYLGLAGHPALSEAMSEAVEQAGCGAGAAHLVNGHHRLHQQLEQELAAFTERPRALLFSTGYMANLGVISALLTRGDAVFLDKLDHASLVDGALLSRARLYRYPHNDLEALAEQLKRARGRRKLIVCDGVFSMDGDLAPLPELAELAARHNAWLMVDDAHGLGVLGERGRGSLEYHRLGLEQVPILVGTLGKAFGVFGAFVAGEDNLIESLIQFARSYIYTTALPPVLAAATRRALRLGEEEPWRRRRLFERVDQFRRGAARLGLPLMPSPTPIQPLPLGDSHRALRFSQALLAENILVTAIRPPTVPRGAARLRVTLSAAHEPEQVEQLLIALGKIRKTEDGGQKTEGRVM